MADLDAVLEQLRAVRKCAEGELKQLEKVIYSRCNARAWQRSCSDAFPRIREPVCVHDVGA
jgi:hypothetical protein